jgi:dolichyl-phosphate-mannose--protein O-mannosyl transferase
MQESTTATALWNRQTIIFLLFVTFLSFLTYFYRYADPPRVYWDENYHIAASQKYLNGVYFMEQHPPLGKLLIALGEKLIHPNPPQYDQMFVGTDYATNFPDDFSFAGYRFFSALLGWLAAPLLFLTFLLLSRNSLWAALFSFLYIFDNALIVHIRGAMLEGSLIFFIALMILCFFCLLEWGNRRRAFIALNILFGASFALVATTKLFGLDLILLLPAYLFTLLPHWKKIGKAIGFFVLGFLPIYCAVWQIHFGLGGRIVPTLPDNGYYQASDEYKAILAQQKQTSLFSFPVMIRDSLNYVFFYNRGTPRLDFCKADENGSPFYMWPLGAITINYRWETPNGTDYRYLYLQSNPVVWLSALATLLVGTAMLLASVLFELQVPLRRRFLLAVFLGLYASYMIAIATIPRVLYLYHYFPPLFYSFIVFGIVFLELQRIGRWRLTEHVKTIVLLIFAGLIFASYEFYRPFTYYEPLNDQQFSLRALLPVWELTCVHCQKVNPVAVPNK